VLLVPVKFTNLDFDPCKKKSTQFAPVKFKPIGFNPSFDLSAKKTITWHRFSDMAHAMLDSCDTPTIIFLVKRQKCLGTKIKIREFYRDQNQNSGILQGPKLKLQFFFLFFFFQRTRTEKLPSSTIFSTSSHFFHHFFHLYILVRVLYFN
jgi:hypothetical protein